MMRRTLAIAVVMATAVVGCEDEGNNPLTGNEAYLLTYADNEASFTSATRPMRSRGRPERSLKHRCLQTGRQHSPGSAAALQVLNRFQRRRNGGCELGSNRRRQ